MGYRNLFETCSIENGKETCHHNHILFNLKGNGIQVFSVHSLTMLAQRKLGAPLRAPLKPLGTILICDVRGVSGGVLNWTPYIIAVKRESFRRLYIRLTVGDFAVWRSDDTRQCMMPPRAVFLLAPLWHHGGPIGGPFEAP